MRVACFDIGRKNFAFYVEEIVPSDLESLRDRFISLAKKDQRRIRGDMNPKVEEIHRDLFKCGKRVEMRVTDLTDESGELNNNVRLNLQTFLEEYEELWNTCNIFVIEEQYYNPHVKFGGAGGGAGGSGINKDAILLGEACYTYFINNHYPFRDVMYFKSMLKTQTFGCPDYTTIVNKEGLRTSRKTTKPDRKKWSVVKGKEILELRGDEQGLNQIINGKKIYRQKQDDVCDCILMCQAYIFKTFVIPF